MAALPRVIGSTRPRPRGMVAPAAWGAVLAGLLLVVTACGQGSASTGASGADSAKDPTSSASSTAKLPADVVARGTLRVASDTNFPPLEYIPENETKLVGLDVDIANALADVLGIKVEFVNTKFDGIIPALAAGRYDMGMSGINHTEERAKVVDFVDYLFNPGTSLVVPKGNPQGLKVEPDLCGHRIGVLNGTVQQTQLQKISEECTSGSKPGVEISTYPLFPNAVVALQSKRIDAVIGGGMPVLYQVKQSDGAFEDVRLATADVRYGIAVPKKSSDLKAALEEAFLEITADGTYAEILEKWGATEYQYPKK